MRCLLIGKVWPEPSSTAAGRRTLDVINALILAGWEVHFASPAQIGQHACDLNSLGVTTHTVQVNDSRFDSWIAELRPETVIFDRFMTEEQFGWRVAGHCPEAMRVLDTSDLHCLRIAREQQLKQGGPLELKNEIALREIAAIFRSDLTLMISEFEMEILRREFSVSDELLAYWPFAVDPSDETSGYHDREHFILIGSFMHPPNLDAARWCKEQIWPLIRAQVQDAELHCYGSYGERYCAELDAPDHGIRFMGRAEDALATMQKYRLNLAPLRYGAGLKGKVFDGFQTGTPTVMTAIAAEGIHEGGDCQAYDAAAFACEAARIYADKDLWQERQRFEAVICREKFDPGFWMPRLPKILTDSSEALAGRREANFVGQMLRHHQHRSTEFMSRWIEAKNA